MSYMQLMGKYDDEVAHLFERILESENHSLC